MALKLIDASEVTSGKSVAKKIVKSVAKNVGIKLVDEPNVVPVDATVKNIVESDRKSDVIQNGELAQGTIEKTIRTIKLKQDIYYGPKNANKNKFVRIYKKLGLVWKSENINGIMVDGWFNKDKSQYITKLPEEGEFKRFGFYGCDDIYSYFISLGAVAFKLSDKENSGIIVNNKENINGVNIQNRENISGTNIACDFDEDHGFIGADLWSGYRTRQLLKNVPDNWGVIWK